MTAGLNDSGGPYLYIILRFKLIQWLNFIFVKHRSKNEWETVRIFLKTSAHQCRAGSFARFITIWIKQILETRKKIGFNLKQKAIKLFCILRHFITRSFHWKEKCCGERWKRMQNHKDFSSTQPSSVAFDGCYLYEFNNKFNIHHMKWSKYMNNQRPRL